jgi:hypothetical protein
MPVEKRWIVLMSDGRHVSIGRHTDPSPSELDAIAANLRQAGAGGWLAVMEGTYYGRRSVELLMVRELVPAEATWEEAVRTFRDIRTRAAGTDPASPRT